MPPEPDAGAVAAYWAGFCAATGHAGEPDDVYAFGDSATMADALLALVLAGTKRATAGALVDHVAAGSLPAVGDLAVVVDGQGRPGAVLRTTEVRTGPLGSVDDAFAWDEGEGDRSRSWWVDGHRAYFRRWFAATGRPAEDDPELVFERFELLWPREPGALRRETERLVLRPWTDDDRPAFAAMNADPVVMEHLPAVLDRAGSDALLGTLRERWAAHGIGLWAVERREDGAFLGFAGLNPMPEGTPPAGEWEVGWRFVRDAWGHGYATEAAREAVRVAREQGLPRLWSMTVPANRRSAAVMRRIGMVEDARFDNPRFEVGHRLREHLLFRLDLDEISSQTERRLAPEASGHG